jgi:hypothetical protein
VPSGREEPGDQTVDELAVLSLGLLASGARRHDGGQVRRSLRRPHRRRGRGWEGEVLTSSPLPAGATLDHLRGHERTFDNCFLMRFAEDGRCEEFTEYFIERDRFRPGSAQS